MMRRGYCAVIHKGSDTNYGVSFPDFKTCITVGETIEEAKKMASEALQFHIDGIIKDGLVLPEASDFENVMTNDALSKFLVFVDIPVTREDE